MCTRSGKAVNAAPLLFLCTPPMDMLLYPKHSVKVLLTHLLLLPIAAMNLITEQCIGRKHFLLSEQKSESVRSLCGGSTGRIRQSR